VSRLLAEDAFARGLGIEIVTVDSDGITIAMDVCPEHLNFLGVGHGGVVFSLADCAFSLAANSAGSRAVAIDAHLVLTAATRQGDRLQASVTEVTRGRTLGTYRVVVTRGDGRITGLFTGTVHIGD
jgi:acyl-CoA thioesterase